MYAITTLTTFGIRTLQGSELRDRVVTSNYLAKNAAEVLAADAAHGESLMPISTGCVLVTLVQDVYSLQLALVIELKRRFTYFSAR